MTAVFRRADLAVVFLTVVPDAHAVPTAVSAATAISAAAVSALTAGAAVSP